MTTIPVLVLAIALFGITHMVPVLPRLKAALKRRLGRAYVPLFVAMSIGSFSLVVLAWAAAPFIPLYDPPPWGAHVTFALMFVAFQMAGIFLFPCRLKRRIRAPFALAVLFWGMGHLFANGDAATVVLAGGLMLVAAIMFALAWKNHVQPPSHPQEALLDVAAILTGLIMYVGMILAHPYLIGVPILPHILPQ